ncbi:MAG: hypothetical protein JO015_04390 [Verrucomicrobia bacterium]|nr:hypothetical protein [Verrucomicrobiota bacterium]
MRHAPYEWLNAYLSAHLAELEDVTATPEGRTKAERWFKALVAYFESRRLKTSRQQKNYLSQVRNAIRRALGEHHPALEVVRFDEATWLKINAPAHDRVETRNLNTRFLRNPDAIVARAQALLSDKHSNWADLATGLAVATGRRISELLGAATKLELKTDYSVRFTGQLKRRQDGSGKPFTFEIPTLVPASVVIDAWKGLRLRLGPEALSPRDLNQRFGRQCREAAGRHFAGLIPTREGENDLYMHLFRAIYATLAVHYYCPPRINPTLYKAEIQGHRMIVDADDPKERRSYAASRHYDDYAIADAQGNRDGRQGLRLGQPGVQILEVFRAPVSSAADKQPARSTPMPSPKPTRTAPNATPARRTRQGKSLKRSPAPKTQHWRVSVPAYTALSRDWKGSADEPQPRVLDRVLAFAHAARDLARHLDFTTEQMDPATLLNAFSENFRALGDQAQKAAARLQSLENQQRTQRETDQQKERKLQCQVEELAAERDALSARLVGLQRQLKEAAADTGPRIELLPIAQQLLDLSSRAATLAPPQLQEALMRLAMDAIAQAAGPSSATFAPPGASAALPQVDPALRPRETAPPVSPAEPAAAPGPVATRRTPAPEIEPKPPPQVLTPAPAEATERSGSETPSPSPAAASTPNRHTSQAGEKLAKALRYLTDIDEAAEARGQKWFVSESLLADLTGCFRPAVKRFVAARREQIDDFNRRHGLGSGHNRGRSRMQPDALPELIKTFKGSVLHQPGIEQPF